MFFRPLMFVMMLILVLTLVVLFIIVHVGLISYAFDKMGLPAEYMLSALLLSWFGSWINIPLMHLRTDEPVQDGIVISYFGQRYVIPRWRQPHTTVLAVNLGGAVVPALLSLYLLLQSQAPFRVILATAAVALVAYRLARPVPGLGITVPLFIPPLTAAVVALILVPQQAPLTAYVAGTMGTLIGADLMHLPKLPTLGAPIASIGGAGTFDGVFITGIIAVLLA
jgi:uncharacterized membrane protein